MCTKCGRHFFVAMSAVNLPSSVLFVSDPTHIFTQIGLKFDHAMVFPEQKKLVFFSKNTLRVI